VGICGQPRLPHQKPVLSSPVTAKISAFAVDSSDPLNILLATKTYLLYRLQGTSVKTWSLLLHEGNISNRNYITALEIQARIIYAGTSFNGFFYEKK
jgi:hypothetical protein